jgi:hypothetical protein
MTTSNPIQEKKQQGSFELHCLACKNPMTFSLLDLDQHPIACSECGKRYSFGEETLKRQLKKFATLCRAIQESEEILGSGGIALTVGNDEVKIPFKILLTRLKSTLDLSIGNERMVISFRVEPVAL